MHSELSAPTAAVEGLKTPAVPALQKSFAQIAVAGLFLQSGGDGIVHVVTVTRTHD